MAAVTITTTPRFGRRAEPTVRPTPRASAATYRRRRAVAAGLALAAVVVAARAAGALGDSPLAVSERRPASSPADAPASYVVEPGDSLWSIAERLAPAEDPRPLVDALSDARGGAPLLPGETIFLPR